MKSGLTRKDIEKRIVKDLFIGIGAIVILAWATHFLDLLGSLAEWTNTPQLKEADPIVVVVLYSVWLFGIFSLCRLYELRAMAGERSKIEKRVYETQKMESLARIATGIAHDFNNLLMAITGYCDVALDRVSPGDQVRGDLMEIKNAGNKASSLVQRLLNFSRRKKPDTELLDLNQVVSELKPLLHHLVGKNVEMTSNLQEDLGRIRANLTQVEEVLVNLVLNAHDAMPDGGKLTIRTSKVSLDRPDICQELGLKPGDYVKLSVKNTGFAIDPKIKDHIFDPFFSTKEKGTGLGLSMVSGIVKQNGGAIEVDSEHGRGTTFKIYLPCIQQDSIGV